MPYPTTALPVVVEIAPGAVLTTDPGTWPWVDVTGDWRYGDGITIAEGRGDWGQRVDAGSIGLTFDNPDGHYSQYNPRGRWYGLLGRDTPLRVLLRRVADSFARTSASGWQLAESGQSWSPAGGVGTDYTVVPGAARISVGALGSSRNSIVNVDLVDVTVAATVAVPVVAAAGATLRPDVIARWTSGANTYLFGLVITSDGVVKAEFRRVKGGTFSGLGTVTLAGVTHTAGKAYRLEFRCVGDQLQGRAWPTSSPRPSAWTVTATDTGHTGPGLTGCRAAIDGAGQALPVVFSWSDFSTTVELAGGYVPAWVPRWGDLAAADRYVPVVARGALYRIQPGTGKAPARSPMYRSTAAGAVAYWPAEDGDNATAAASGTPGHPPLTINGPVTFAPIIGLVTGENEEERRGTGRLANLAAGASLTGVLPAAATAATATSWTVGFCTQIGDTLAFPAVEFPLMEWRTPGGTFERWQLTFRNVGDGRFGPHVYAFDRNDVQSEPIPLSSGITNSYTLFEVSAWQSGANISLGFRYFGAGNWEATGSVPGTLAGVSQVAINPNRITNTLAWPVGHVQVWAEHPYPLEDVGGYPDGYESYPLAYVGPRRAWLYEPAHLRLARLGAEDGIPVAVQGPDPGGAVRMGYQPAAAALDLYRQCEDADGGVIYERPFAVAYQSRNARYNQPPALIVDAAAGDLAEAPEADPDGQSYRNRVTASRPEGSSATVETPDVTDGSALVYDESVDVSVWGDDNLADLAGWRLHLASQSGARWPRLDLDLAARPQLIDAWLNCRVGSRVQVVNPPADVAGEDVDVLMEGHTTKLGYKDWDVSINASPARPWDVATVDGEQRVAADGSTLAAAIPSPTALSFSLASTPENGVWTTDPADFPLAVRVGGERMTLSAITGTTSPQTATVAARGVNGVQLAWPAGTPADVWFPATFAL